MGDKCECERHVREVNGMVLVPCVSKGADVLLLGRPGSEGQCSRDNVSPIQFASDHAEARHSALSREGTVLFIRV